MIWQRARGSFKTGSGAHEASVREARTVVHLFFPSGAYRCSLNRQFLSSEKHPSQKSPFQGSHLPLTIYPFTAMATCLLPFTSSKPQNPNPNAPKPNYSLMATKTSCSSLAAQSQSAKRHLLRLISDQERGIRTQKDPARRASIVEAIDAMAVMGRDIVTTGGSLSATWRLLWTTEKEQLFIVENARLFGTRAGDVLQVIDVENRTLNNVITFPPDGVFFVRSDIEIASAQRVNFRYFTVV